MSPRMQVDAVLQERYWYPDDGGQVWVAGYQLVDAGGRYLARGAPQLEAAGLMVLAVAGAGRHHADALQSDAAAPGRPLVLARDPGNEFDANAIAVETAAGERLGFVAREPAAGMAPRIDGGEAFAAVALREQRASPRDPRTGLTILVGPGPTLELVLTVPRD